MPTIAFAYRRVTARGSYREEYVFFYFLSYIFFNIKTKLTAGSQAFDDDTGFRVRGEEPVVSARRISRTHTGHVPLLIVLRQSGSRPIRLRSGRSRGRRAATAHLGTLNSEPPEAHRQPDSHGTIVGTLRNNKQ